MELVPAEPKPEKAREVTIEIDGMDFADLSEQLRRARRNYNARRRRVEGRDPRVRAMRLKWRDAQRQMVAIEKRLEIVYAAESRAIDSRPSVRLIRQQREKIMRRERRLRIMYDTRLEQELGKKPVSPLQHLLNSSDELSATIPLLDDSDDD